ncbi:acyl-CoA dehydrogenase [Nocardioides acrostichi]|uniref:Acyl-CoA dehydrogenase n=1 Tax=Nocardioides acrostichi TaxID=2784339 RepID=A0A930YCL8_9ACTN|nr:acyl-CoA dehydrogenase [Nocardioides acrostichi]MBF4161589.1 acyl-CoA dehydrogenase [Nocardioides acrostichi]
MSSLVVEACPATVVLPGAEGCVDFVASLAEEVPTGPADLSAAVDWAREVGRRVPRPGEGATAVRWSVLATVAARDLTWARVLEPHLDALAILGEADELHLSGRYETWGVWAAEGGDAPLAARWDERSRSWLLDGVKPWCSLAAVVDRGLVTAWVDHGSARRMFAVSTSHPGLSHVAQSWVSRGLADLPTASIRCRDVTAQPVGRTGWYLDRPGFAWGGIGVAAVWYGAALALLARLQAASRARQPDQIALMHLGASDAALTAAGALLGAAAREVDHEGRHGADGSESAIRAARVRHVVHDAAEDVLDRCGHALGPAPLTYDEEHARRVADLTVYLRQHHAERDSAALGRALLETPHTLDPGGR